MVSARLAITLFCASLMAVAVAFGQVAAVGEQSPQKPPGRVITVHVIDPENQPVTNLKQSDFSISEDGTSQEITYFSNKDHPVTCVLALDRSGSLGKRGPEVLEAASRVINAKNAADEMFIITFQQGSHAVSEAFTSDKPQLMRELRTIPVEGAGGTALIDALWLSLDPLAEQRKKWAGEDRVYAIVLITDGDEHESFYKEKDLFSRLAKQDVEVVSVSFTKYPGDKKLELNKQQRDRALALQTRLAKETGGWAYFPDTGLGVQVAASQVMPVLRHKYSIGYEPSGPANKDSTRRIVSVLGRDGAGSPQYNVMFRSGPSAASK
jgi:VWFA-related protein